MDELVGDPLVDGVVLLLGLVVVAQGRLVVADLAVEVGQADVQVREGALDLEELVEAVLAARRRA